MERWIDYELLEWEQLKETYGIDEHGIITVPTASPNNCGDRCQIRIELQNGKIKRMVTGGCGGCEDEKTPQVRACVKGQHYLDTFLHKDRLLYPMKRVGKRGEGKFERISWDEALDTIARENNRIRDTYGPASRYVNYATGYEMCTAVPPYMMRRLLNFDGGHLRYYNNYSDSPSTVATEMLYGTDQSGNSPEDFENASLILLWSHNPAETICGNNFNYYIKRAKEKGAKIVVIDPRYSDTAAAFADEWIAPLPTTDSALSDAMAYVIYTKGLHNQEFLDTYCIGFEDKTLPEGIPAGESYLSYLLGEKDGVKKTPEWAEKITGVDAETIEKLAVEYATTKPAAIIEGYGAGRHAYGEQFSRGLITLACMTGNVGIPGGSAAGVGQCSFSSAVLPEMPPAVEDRVKVRIPCFLWTRAVEEGVTLTPEDGLKYGDHLDSNIKMIFNLAGNCLINQHGDCNYTKRLLEDESKVEFIVCSDIFMTASARFADILLPGTTMLETANITAMPNKFDILFKTNPVIKPLGECRFDYDWMCDLAKRLGHYEEFSEGKTLEEWLRCAHAELKQYYPNLPDYETFSKQGMYREYHEKPRIAFEKEIADPQNYPFPTASGKIELFSKELYQLQDEEERPAIPKYIPAWEGPEDDLRETYPLQCIGFHTKARTHSVHDNNAMLQSLIPHRLWMNTEDAAKRQIADGDMVLVYNARGKVKIPVKVTDRIVRGVVAMPQGAWFMPNEDGVDVRGCVNTLSSLRPTAISKANAQHTALVEVEKLLSENRLDGALAQGKAGKNKPLAIEDRNSQIASETRHVQAASPVCSGCQTCVAACQNAHGLPEGVACLSIKEASPGESQCLAERLTVCLQCEDAACEGVCPKQAIKKDEEGIRYIDAELCVGCGSCQRACPQQAIQIYKVNGKRKAVKCDLCKEQRAQGKGPACVAACLLRSLIW